MEDTELHMAVRLGDLDDVEKALCEGFDPNQIGLYDWSPLHEASFNGDLDIVQLLLKFKGDPNQPDALRGFTAMHYAANQRNVECLQELINAGGKRDITDNEGHTCLDVAQGGCLELLKKLSQNEAQKNPIHEEKLTNKSTSCDPSLAQLQQTANSDTDGDSQSEYERSSAASSIDLDRISLASDCSTSSASSWRKGIVTTNKDLAVMGHATLSFEYNKKAETFKVRVWELRDFVLPPVETSMIQDIFVRSYLLPDKGKKTKRNTDNISAAKLAKSATSTQVFSPVMIKFTKALEYKNVTPQTVKEKTVYLEICLRQKYTWRNFVVATWNTSMSHAVKYLTKEKYPLTPKLSTTIPSNMKLYSAHQLHVTSQRGLVTMVTSCPNSRTASMSSLGPPSKELRACSDSDLRMITVHHVSNPSTKVTVPSDDEDELVTGDGLKNVVTAELPQEKISISMTVLTEQKEDLHFVTSQE